MEKAINIAFRLVCVNIVVTGSLWIFVFASISFDFLCDMFMVKSPITYLDFKLAMGFLVFSWCYMACMFSIAAFLKHFFKAEWDMP